MMSLQVMHGVISVLNPYGHRLQVQPTGSLDEEAMSLALLQDGLVDGAVAIPAADPHLISRYQEMAASARPIVLVDHYIPGLDVDWVATDNVKAAHEAVASLIARGHRRIAHFTDFEELTSVIDREAGYRAALEGAGLPCDEEIICGPQNLRGGKRDFHFPLEHCLKLPDPVTAVFCMNDDIVWAAMHAAQRLGISVPNQLEIAGFFDDHISPGVNVPFTRVVQSTFDMGRVAAELLLERINGTAPRAPRHIQLPVTVIPGNADPLGNV